MSTKTRGAIGWLSCVILLSGLGCAGIPAKNSGRITLDQGVTALFEKYEMRDDMTYYISGSDVYPNAILGLKKTHGLDDSSLWKKIDMTPDMLETLVGRMQDRVRFLNRFQYGAAIYDPQGNPIGIWYSMLEAITAVQMTDERTVIIYTPDIDTYQKYEDGRLR
jgi:hypothetical protein